MTTALATLAGNGQPATTNSLVVAEKFGKRHKDVLKAVRNLECSDAFRGRNFAPTFYAVPGPNNSVRQEEMYEITRDGFAFLAMGFTGAEAARWKEAFLDAFNQLESAWKTSPLALLGLREQALRQRACGLHPLQQAHVQGLLRGGHALAGNILGQAEYFLDHAPPVPENPPRFQRKPARPNRSTPAQA